MYGGVISDEAKDRKAHETRTELETGVSTSSSCILDFPSAILLEFFLRLPIHAIIRCKLVCKSWLNLLSDPNFATIYTSNPPFTTLLLSEYNFLSIEGFFLLEFSQDGNFTRTPLKSIVPDCLETGSIFVSLVGSSNALLCIRVRKCIPRLTIETVYISNPITRECISLPQHRIHSKYGGYVVHVFCFNPSANNFKVLRGVYTSVEVGNEKSEIEIFTVGVDSRWRSLANPETPLSFWSEGVSLNGAYHMMVVVDENTRLICTFDFETETNGRNIDPPAFLPSFKRTRLAVLNNHLCLVSKSDPSEITIWTMSEYGVSTSWAKDVIFRYWFPSLSCLDYEEIFPVVILPNGAILFKDFDSNYLVLFDPKQKRSANIRVSDVDVVKGRVTSISIDMNALSFS